MSTSVGTKTKKKQTAISDNTFADQPLPDRKFESAILSLENICVSILDSQFTDISDSAESTYWQQIFINIATPVSLALMESKGPRHFHYHYRHRPENESILHPVLENPVDMLAQVCEDALKQCHKHFIGIHDKSITKRGRTLEMALQSFLLSYEKFQAKD